MEKSVADVAAKLESLTQQLNEYCPMHESDVTAGTEHLSGSVDACLQTQNLRMDELSQSMQETRRESASNAETIQTLFISIENLSENF